MDYQKHYNNLIEKANHRSILPGYYTEIHHIIPKCLGGCDNSENLVKLFPEEHFIAHLLLARIYSDNRKLLLAAQFMTISPTGKRNNNKMFAWIKVRLSELGHSEETKKKMSKSQTGKKRSIEQKLRMSVLQKEAGGYGPKEFSEDHKNKISRSNTGKKKSFRSEEHKKKLSISLKGKKKTTGFSGRSHSIESKKLCSLTQLNKNLEPWETGSVINNPKLIELWMQLDIFYNTWVTMGKCGHSRICSSLKMPIYSSVENMIKWFRKNGNPILYQKWIDFKNQ